MGIDRHSSLRVAHRADSGCAADHAKRIGKPRLLRPKSTVSSNRKKVCSRRPKNSRTPFTADQQQALPAAHQLVDRKTFSWSGLLADLESSLPSNVKVSRISIRDVSSQANQTVAQLDLAVFAKNPSTITEMIAAMHKEGIFQAELRSQNLQKGRGESGTEYELAVVYRSRQSFSRDSVAEVDQTRRGGEVQR